MVRDRASRLMPFSDWPSGSSTRKVGISDIGMAVAVISVARQSRRKMNTTTTARTAPSSRASSEAM